MLDVNKIKNAISVLEDLMQHTALEAANVATQDIKECLTEDLFAVVFDDLSVGKITLSPEAKQRAITLSKICSDISELLSFLEDEKVNAPS